MILTFFEKGEKIPVKDFILSLQDKDWVKVHGCLKSIKELGFKTPRVDFRQIDGKLWEIKIVTISGGVRIFYTSIQRDEMVLLHGYKKKSQKAPKKELDIAFQRMKEISKKE